jgi:DNA-directed RNA polymerase subunit M/transcription elongation factor TFIIS
MAITIQCPNCGKMIEGKAQPDGTTACCPKCTRSFSLPAFARTLEAQQNNTQHSREKLQSSFTTVCTVIGFSIVFVMALSSLRAPVLQPKNAVPTTSLQPTDSKPASVINTQSAISHSSSLPTLLWVKVPTGAKVFVNGQEHPVILGACAVSFYDETESVPVRVEYSADGKQHADSKLVSLKQHDTTSVDFTYIDPNRSVVREQTGSLAQSNKGKATYNYWCSASNIMSKAASSRKDDKPQSMISMCKTIISGINALSTSGVDEDAINSIQDVADFMRHNVQYKQETNSDASWDDVLLIMRGGALGRASELLGEQRIISKQLQSTLSKLSRTRSILSSRYDIEFPEIQ